MPRVVGRYGDGRIEALGWVVGGKGEVGYPGRAPGDNERREGRYWMDARRGAHSGMSGR